MADHNKGGFISKAQKRLTRTKTKVLQNLGKAEKTADEKFDEHVLKLERQQEVAHRFNKELRNYIHCAKAMELASKSFYGVMLETYEPEWKEETKLRETLQSLELMWADYLQHLQESVQAPLSTYMGHFHPLKQKIAKRHRKLDYYDNARHNAEVQQNAKKKDEAKISKANEELEESKRIYEVLNNDLHNELPECFNSRINFFATTFTNFFNAENTFHSETGKLNETAMSITESLAEDHKQYTYQPRPLSGVITNEDSGVNGHSSGENDSKHSTPPTSKREKSPKPERPPSSPATFVNPASTPDSSVEQIEDSVTTPSTSDDTPVKTNGEGLTNGLSSDDLESPPESPQTESVPKTEPEVQKKGPLYENSELSYSTSSKVEQATTENESESSITQSAESLVTKTEEHVVTKTEEHVVTKTEEHVVTKIEEPVVKAEMPVVNGPNNDEVQDQIKDTSKNESVEDNEDIPAYPPPQPPSEPQETPAKQADIPTKPVENIDIVNEDDSDHYYDKVPDQLDIKEDKSNVNEDDDLYEVPSSSKIPDILPEGCQYVVVATHLYKNEDEDELSFEAGELIYVIPFEDPDDQDEGWSLGIKKSDGKKGVFPENFTKRV